MKFRLNIFCRDSFSLLSAALLVLASVRGFLIVSLGFSAVFIYNFTSFFLILLSLIGFLESFKIKRSVFSKWLVLLRFNLFFFVIYTFIEALVFRRFDFSILYYVFAPYSVFVFIKLDRRAFLIALRVIAIMIAFSVADNFLTTLSGESGLSAVRDYNLKLRPDLESDLSRTGDFFRVGGYTGSYHDSANILGILSSFFWIRYLIYGKFNDILYALGSIFALALTQSAANILILIFTIFIFSLIVLFYKRRLKIILTFTLIVALLSILVLQQEEIMTIFLQRIDTQNGDWEGMKTGLNFQSFLDGIIFVLVGHAGAFNALILKTEIALFKQVLEFGIVQALVHLFVLAYPLNYFRRRLLKDKYFSDESWPTVAALFFGIVSLAHYGSLLRITSIFLYYSIFGFFFVLNRRSAS